MGFGMEKHPYFDLWLHSTDALEGLLGVKISARETIHDWPLSTVQKITTIDGTCLIYKVQHLATVEPKFYQAASSRLLPQHRYLGEINSCETMAFEFIQGRRLRDCHFDEATLLRMGRELQSEIQAIRGELPAFTDISDSIQWKAFSNTVLARLKRLIEQGLFPEMDISLVGRLADWAGGSAVLDTVNNESGFTHGDLNAENIFIVPDGYRLIDWQRPRYAPRDVDLVGLLLDGGFNPLAHVKQEVVQIYCFLTIDWLTLCKASLIPEATEYERYVIDASDAILKPRVPARWGEL